LFRFWDGQIAEEDGVDDRENGVIGADSQCQHHHRDNRKPAVLRKQAHRIANVPEQIHERLLWTEMHP
jgi:hypothetical protein